MSCTVLTSKSAASKHQIVSDALLSAKRVVILTGAGISCTAGIPDFRSKDGLYNLLSSKANEDSSTDDGRPSKRVKRSHNIKGQDLFSANVFRDAEQTALFYTFMSSLYTMCTSSQVKPTPTHHFIAKLAKKGRLQRCYTQNLDSLEDKAGLTQAIHYHAKEAEESSSRSRKKWEGNVVQLHGRIDRVKCGCGWQGEWSEEMCTVMQEGQAPLCPDCDEKAALRQNQRKRPVKQVGHYGTLKPSIVLYDDPSPPSTAESILQIEEYDLSKKIDFVLVMGTSLKVPGFKTLVKDFVNEARQKNPTKKVVSVLVNATDVLTAEWKSTFDYFVLDQCDAFVNRVITQWKKKKPEDWLQQTALSALTNATKVGLSAKDKNKPGLLPSALPVSNTKQSSNASASLKRSETNCNLSRAPLNIALMSPSTPPALPNRRITRTLGNKLGFARTGPIDLITSPHAVSYDMTLSIYLSPLSTPVTRSRSRSLTVPPALYVSEELLAVFNSSSPVF